MKSYCECVYCGRRLTTYSIHWDHFIPLSRGGHDEGPNLVSSCKSCNLSKHCRLLEEWRADASAILRPRIIGSRLRVLLAYEGELLIRYQLGSDPGMVPEANRHQRNGGKEPQFRCDDCGKGVRNRTDYNECQSCENAWLCNSCIDNQPESHLECEGCRGADEYDSRYSEGG